MLNSGLVCKGLQYFNYHLTYRHLEIEIDFRMKRLKLMLFLKFAFSLQKWRIIQNFWPGWGFFEWRQCREHSPTYGIAIVRVNLRIDFGIFWGKKLKWFKAMFIYKNYFSISIFKAICIYSKGYTPGKYMLGLKIISCNYINVMPNNSIRVVPGTNLSFKS